MSLESPSTTAPPRKATKSRRNPRACDACSRRSVRCQPATNRLSSCQNCVDFNERCTFDRPALQRGRRPRANHVPLSTPALDTLPACADQTKLDWTPQVQISQALVMDLTDIFFEVVYPVFPLFHRRSLIRKVSRGEHMQSRPLYASVAAMCALSSARARDGALLRDSCEMEKLRIPTSEQLFEAAVDAIPHDLLANQSLDYMRACLLLSITGIQYGLPSCMKYYLSRYQTYVAVGSLHDETHWPPETSVIEVEERRRLFWSAYTLDVFTSVVWGGVISSREASSNVNYPTEDDEQDLETSRNPADQVGVSWLRGWNYVTDMYRILEYAASDLQQSRASVSRTPTIPALENRSSLSQSAVLDRITTMYQDLPTVFKTTAPPTNDFRRDLYSFQAANIAATVQLVRMVYFSSDASTLLQKCQVAGEVLTAFGSMPTAYLRAISSPLLHHLAEIGRIFGAAFSSGMSASLYHSVRSVLLDLVALLANMEKELCFVTDASKKVESQVSRIDRFIHEQVQSSNESTEISARMDQYLEPQNADTRPVGLSKSNFEKQSPLISLPTDFFEDWDWAFTFT